MFKLRRLEITGFKSFADHTDLIFTGDGITGVVGPNGCGKSNVADAIAWVLGEQRVKHLRGAEMKDVIFQGSRNRKPSGLPFEPIIANIPDKRPTPIIRGRPTLCNPRAARGMWRKKRSMHYKSWRDCSCGIR